jgi:hypothetical protein
MCWKVRILEEWSGRKEDGGKGWKKSIAREFVLKYE